MGCCWRGQPKGMAASLLRPRLPGAYPTLEGCRGPAGSSGRWHCSWRLSATRASRSPAAAQRTCRCEWLGHPQGGYLLPIAPVQHIKQMASAAGDVVKEQGLTAPSVGEKPAGHALAA